MATYFVAANVQIKKAKAPYMWSTIVELSSPIVFAEDLINLRKIVYGKIQEIEEKEVESVFLTALTLLDAHKSVARAGENNRYAYWIYGIGGGKNSDEGEWFEEYLVISSPILSDEGLRDAEVAIEEMNGYSKVFILNIEFLITYPAQT